MAGPFRPRLECLIGLPLRHHEVAVLTLDRTQQLKAEETGLVLHRVCAMGEPLLQFGASVGGYLDCVDLHHWHAARLPRPLACPLRRGTQDGRMPGDLLTSPWRPRRAVGPGARPDGPGHHLVAAAAVADPVGRRLHLRRAVAPRPRRRRSTSDQHRTVRRRSRRRGRARWARRPGWSGTRWARLHSWCLAAERPDLVSALVVEDMAPDFRGRTTGPWEPWLHALPVEFDSARTGIR